MKWFLLILGIITELTGALSMKMSEGFTNLFYSILTFIFWGISLSIFNFALKGFDLSFAYAIWAGMGILLISLVGIIYFNEPVNLMKIISMLLIVAGVVLLNLNEFITKSSQ